MRHVWPLLPVTVAGIAHADPGWSEYGTTTRLRSAAQLVEASCELDVTLRGAFVEVEQRVRLTNSGFEALAATRELVLPSGAHLVGVEVKRGTGRATSALAVRTPLVADRVGSPSVLGADAALVTALDPMAGRPRFRMIVQPIDAEQDTTITTRWTRAADIRGGALHVVLPGNQGQRCRGVVHATPGPGTTVARVRIDGTEVAARTFALEATDVAIAVELAFKRAEPVVWTQTESLGDGWHAQAITIATPATKALTAKRALFVIDGSRSMELVGRHNVSRLVHAIGGALPQGTPLDAIIYDRTAQRVLGAWQPLDGKQLATIESAIASHTASNGSDAAAALVLAKQAIGGAAGETLVVLITDGVLGDVPDTTLLQALATGTQDELDLHAFVLATGQMHSPDIEPVQKVIDRIGGSVNQISVDDLDVALADLDEWLRPAWLDMTLPGFDVALPDQLHAGSGIVLTTIVKKPAKPALTGRGTKPFKVTAAPALAAPVAEIALSRAHPDEVGGEAAFAQLRLRHASVDSGHALVVLATEGKVAKSRREVAASGGPFTRMVAIDDPAFPPEVRIGRTITGGSAIDRDTLKLLFRTHLQPAAFACYQRALARLPKLAGTAQFRLEIGRGEMTRAQVSGLGDPTFDACLLDAAYKVTPALPNPSYNSDDRTIANYPLTFTVREDKPYVVPGDADSSTPFDISAIRGGVPVKIKAGDTTTPLGDLRVPKNP